ncbi:MAG: tRNA (N6-isopentenyl adenosine(37)-C2)-methylthiotransferase MiaB, partial [Thermoanaerobaculia bacterium]|nr:tRNA (N6-isopentenyl adenosine(37)-C2)-methylthiotransferase MiaB [Thermoanaerobaculia bacterium]
GRIRPLKDERGTRIGVAGCVAQQEGDAIIRRAPYVDFVMGPGTVGLLDEILDGSRRVATEFPDDRRYDWLTVDRPSPVRAQITVIEGCNKNCTHCIVPTTRGREISRSFQSILKEVRHAVSTGRTEIELLGQTVNAYRCPETGKVFGELLEGVAVIEGVRRVRFVTSHPSAVDQRMIEAIRDHSNICRYLHLPAQSGSSKILRRMKRLYTRERYLEVLDWIRSEVPDVRFSGDFIVGFPGETDEDFEQTLSLMETVRYGSLFAFVYSPRPGTPALRLADEVDPDVARQRLNRLFEIQARIERETLERYVGRTVDVLHEGASKHSDAIRSGKTEDNWTVNFSSDAAIPVGAIVPVLVREAGNHTLKGEAVR